MASGRIPKARVKVTVSRARNLRAADFSFRGKGSSDPYVTFWVKGRPLTELKTEIVHACLDPEWNFTGLIDECKHGDSIEFQVWDHDRIGQDDLLGRATLDFGRFFPAGYVGTLPLKECGKKESTLDVKLEVVPTYLAELDERPRCFVTVHQAKDLLGADHGGKSDPFTLVRVFGKTAAFRTRVVPKTLNPSWEEEDEVPDFELGDDLEFVVYDWDRLSDDDELGRVVLQASNFTPDGFTGELELTVVRKAGPTFKGTIMVTVELDLPPPPKSADPAAHVTADDRKPAPFRLRCMDTGRMHRLVCYTVIGRSHRHLDARYDLVLDSPGSNDVSRLEHAVIKCWSGVDPTSWRLRIYNRQVGRGAGFGPGGGHSAGGTSVDNVAVRDDSGAELEPGNVIRFGVREMWVVESAALYQKSRSGEHACSRARNNATEDPGSIRELRVPSSACNHALQHCGDWDSLVRVVLEWCGEPDEPPCVDAVEVLDECGTLSGRYEARSLEEQEVYDMRRVLKEVRMGCTIRLRLSADPCLLAPILRKLDAYKKRMKALHNAQSEELFSYHS